MKWRIRWHAEWCTTILIALLIVVGPFRSQAWAQAEHVRWDLVTITITNGTVAPGGTASAQAQDGSTIFMTGSGTFVAPSKNGNSFGSNGSAKGGGTWTITGPHASAGTYEVVGLVRWEREPGHHLPPIITNDAIDEGEPSSGLAVLRIEYSDGERGILVVSCNLPPPRADMFEGITATKGVVDYKMPVAGFTLFHVR